MYFVGQNLILRMDVEGVSLNGNVCVPRGRVQIGSNPDKMYSPHSDVFWVGAQVRYYSSGILTCELSDAHPGQVNPFFSQSADSSITQLILTGGEILTRLFGGNQPIPSLSLHRRSSVSARPDSKSPTAPPPSMISSLLTGYPIREYSQEYRFRFEEMRIVEGAALFDIVFEIPRFRMVNLELRVENDFLEGEFEYIKPYIAKRLGRLTLNVSAIIQTQGPEVVNWANTFGQLFPSSLFFDGVKPITSGTPLKSGLLSWGPDEMSLTIKDWRDPLKQLKNVGGKRLTALMYFVMLDKIDEVRELLALGADVNILSSSNDSALLMAIQRATPTEPGPTDTAFFDAIGAIDHDEYILNTPTDKRKLTVLGCAVESGNPAIVKRVLEMGADPNLRCDVDQVSPLFKAVRAFSGLPGFDEFLSELKKGSPELMESIRRHAPGLAGVDFTSLPKNLDHLRDNPRHQKFGKEIFEYFQNQHATIRDEDRYQIISMLLKYGADPNEPHNINGWKGYTPLMLAITQGRPEVVAEMLRKGNPIQVKLNQKAALPDGRQFDAKKLALVYQSQAVLDLLRGAEK